MKTKELSGNIERAVIENLPLRLTLIFFIVPLLFLLLTYWFREQVVLGWLIFTGVYAITLLIPAFAGKRSERRSHRVIETSRNLLAMLSPLMWGGLIAIIYYVLYMLMFDRENFFPL